MKGYLYGFIVLAIAASAAVAQTPPQKVPLKQLISLPLHDLEIGSVKAGMTPETVNKVLKEADERYEFKSNLVSLGGIIKGARIATADFTEELSAHIKGTNSDLIRMKFSTPASGNQLISLTRSFGFQDAATAPTLDQLAKSVTDKYGPKSFQTRSGSYTRFYWAFKDGKIINCPNPTLLEPGPCGNVKVDPYSAGSAQSFASRKPDYDAVLSVSFKSEHSEDQVGFMTLDFIDYKRAIANATADVHALEALADEVGPAQKAAPRL